MDGSRRSFSPLRAHGRHSTPWLRRSRANQIQFTLILALVATMFAAFPALAGKVSKPPKKSGTIGVLSATTRTVCSSGCDFSTISAAIAGATVGDTISIAAGTYAETVTVNKRLLVQGAGSSGDSATGTVVTGSITISASGADASNRTVVRDLSVTNSAVGGDGVSLSAGTSYASVINVRSSGNASEGVEILGGSAAQDLVFDQVILNDNGVTGLRMGANVNLNGLTLKDSQVKRNNAAGFSYNASESAVALTGVTISGTVFEHNGDTAYAGSQLGTGDIVFYRFSGSATLTNVTVTGLPSSPANTGIQFRGPATPTAAGAISVNGLTMTGKYARPLGAAQLAGYPGYGLAFLDYSSVSSITLSGLDISLGYGHPFYAENLSGTLSLGNAQLTAAGPLTGYHVLLSAPSVVVNATGATFGGVATSGATNAQLFTIADRVFDSVDVAGAGLVRLKAANIYVTPDSYLSPYSSAPSIQRGIDAATAGDTVNVKAGTYVGDLTIDRQLTLSGPNAGVAAGPGPSLPSRNAEAVIQGSTVAGAGVTVAGVVVDGLKFIRPAGAVATDDVRLLSNAAGSDAQKFADDPIANPAFRTTVRNSIFDLALASDGTTRGCGSAFSSTQNRAGNFSTVTFEHNRVANQVYSSCPSGNSRYFSRAIYLDSAAPGGLIHGNRFIQTNEVYITDSADATVISGNRFESGGMAIAVGAVEGAVVSGNTFVNPQGAAVYLDQSVGALIEDNVFLDINYAYAAIQLSETDGVLIQGNSFTPTVTYDRTSVTPTYWTIGVGLTVWNGSAYVLPSKATKNTTITNNYFSSDVWAALWNCTATGTVFSQNYIGSQGRVVSGTYYAVRNGHSSASSCTGSSMVGTGNYWAPGAGALLANSTVTRIPDIDTYTDDPAKTGAPGFWPISIVYDSACTATCYVSTTGNDAAAGSLKSPFKTLSKAISSVDTGGTIYVAAGSYTEDVTIGKALTLRGAKYGVAAGPAETPSGRAITSPYTGESVINGQVYISNISGVTLDGFVLVRSTQLIYMNATLSTTIKNNIFIANGGAVGGDFTINKISSSSNAAYVVQNNWFKGGQFGLAINEDTAGSSWLVDGNYASTMNRFVQTFASMNAAATYSNNRIVDVVKGIRIAESYAGTVIQRNTIVASEKAIECGSESGATLYVCESLKIYSNKISGGTDTSLYPTASAIYIKYPKGALNEIKGNRFIRGAKYLYLAVPQSSPTIDATNNVWDNDSAQPGAPRKLDLAGVTVTRIPFISSYTEDSGHTNDPGFWTSATGSESGCAATCYVSTTGDDTNTGTSSFPFLTLAQAIASVDAGGTVAIAAGTFAAQDLHVTKAMTIDGVGATTVLDGAGTAALWIDADDVTISDLTIQDGADGIRFDTGTLISDTTLDTITIKDNSGVGVETRNSTTVDGLQVLDSTFSKNSVGIRWASSGIGIDVVVDGSTFLNQTSGLHIYEANGGSSTGHLDGLTVTDSHFTQTDSVAGNQAGVFVEEARDVTVQGSTFTGLMRGVFLSNIYSGYSGGLAGNYLIDDNDFTDLKYPPVVVETTQLDLPATVSNNVFLQDVTTTAGDRGAVIELRLKSGFDHATVSILDNSVTLSKSEGASVPSSFGVLIRGDYDGVVIRGNTFDGGGVSGAGNGGAVDGSGGTYPQGAGVSVRTNDSSQGAPSASSTLVVQNNWITGFVDGIGFYNAVAKTFGGLPAVNAVSITTNRLAGNSGSGVHNGSDNAVDARANYWGCEAGPNETGCDSTAGSVTSSPYIKIFTLSARTPGWWPSSTVAVAGLTQSDEPQTVPLAGEELGSPSITIASAPAGATVTVEATDPEDLPVASTPFKVDGATLIDIKVSAGVTGPFTICLNGDIKKDRLWHFEDGFWVDMTNRVIAPGSLPSPYPSGQICGMTATLSPFAMAEQVAPGDEDCVYDGNLHSLRVPLAQNESISVARIGTTLYVGSPTYVCVPRTIGDSTWEVYGLVIEGNSGDETVTILDATFANWGGQYSGVDLYRTIDLGTGSGDRVILQGTSGPDSLVVDGFADFSNIEIYRLEGLGDNDYLVGSSVEDELLGGPGADTLRGNAGSDGLIPGAGNDSIQGGSGFDCLSYFDELSSVAVNLNTGSATGASIGTDTFGGIECAQGGQANDSLSGSAGADSLYGGYGDDTLIGRGGNDWLDGGDGSDTASYVDQTYYPVTVNLETGSGSGTGVGTDAFTSIENATGGTAADSLTGSSGPNVLSGGPGADTLVGGGDADTLNGDGESDVLIGNAGDDAINGGSGTDTVSYSEQSDTVTVDLSNSPGSGVSTSAGTDSLTGIENATGGSGQDSLTGSTGPNTLVGGAGADTLNGGDGIDTLRGGDDGDFLNGDAGGDYLYGDAGNDVIRGGTENDTLRGGLGDDILVGGAGDDLFYGDDGTDTVSYDDATYGEAATSGIWFNLGLLGIQQSTGGAGGDTVMGSIENLTGSSYNDKLVGDSGNNDILGLGGDDTIYGTDGDDRLDGGEGTDTISGGNGTDVCVGEVTTTCP